MKSVIIHFQSFKTFLHLGNTSLTLNDLQPKLFYS